MIRPELPREAAIFNQEPRLVTAGTARVDDARGDGRPPLRLEWSGDIEAEGEQIPVARVPCAELRAEPRQRARLLATQEQLGRAERARADEDVLGLLELLLSAAPAVAVCDAVSWPLRAGERLYQRDLALRRIVAPARSATAR